MSKTIPCFEQRRAHLIMCTTKDIEQHLKATVTGSIFTHKTLARKGVLQAVAKPHRRGWAMAPPRFFFYLVYSLLIEPINTLLIFVFISQHS